MHMMELVDRGQHQKRRLAHIGRADIPSVFSSTMERVCSAQVQAQNKHSGALGVREK
jgi:hypothetical protein